MSIRNPLPLFRLCDTIKPVNIDRTSKHHVFLLIGAIVVFLIATLIGFASHDTLGSAGFRMLTTLIPVVFAWLLIAPHLKVYKLQEVIVVRNLWRPPWAMVLAAPMAAFLRGVWLGNPIIPIFVVVLGGANWQDVFAVG